MNLLPLAVLPVCLVAAGPGPVPDVIPPGHKPVEHVLILERGAAADGERFVAFPTRGFGTSVPVTFGQPFRFSGKYGTQIYRLQPGEAWPGDDAVDDAFRAAHAHGIPCGQVAVLPVADPVARIESRYAVAGVDAGGLRFAFVDERRLDAAGEPVSLASLLPWLVGIAVVGAAGLVALARRAPAGAGA